jgi:hypothetical protein
MQNQLIKTPVSLYKSCRGMLDLQLCLLHQGVVQLEIFENNSVKVCQAELFCTLGVQSAPPAPASRVARVAPPTGSGRRGTSATAGSTAPHQRLRPVNRRHAPHVHGPSEPPRTNLVAAVDG